MTISFDIDSTLVPQGNEFPTEPRTLWTGLLGAEPLRVGTVKLFGDLRRKGHLIYIYTTSYRSRLTLLRTFLAHGIRPEKYIAGDLNRKTLARNNCNSSKNPKLFDIDLHVDDLPGVGIEGKQHHFETVIVDPKDKQWEARVLSAVKDLELRKMN